MILAPVNPFDVQAVARYLSDYLPFCYENQLFLLASEGAVEHLIDILNGIPREWKTRKVQSLVLRWTISPSLLAQLSDDRRLSMPYLSILYRRLNQYFGSNLSVYCAMLKLYSEDVLQWQEDSQDTENDTMLGSGPPPNACCGTRRFRKKHPWNKERTLYIPRRHLKNCIKPCK